MKKNKIKRLFAIVLAKLLLFGKDIDDKELYNYKNASIDIAELECKEESFKQMISLG